MIKKLTETGRKRLEWILDTLSLCAVLQYCVYRFLQSTMFNFYYSQTYKILTMGLLLVFGGVRYLRLVYLKLKERDNKGKREFILKAGFAWLLALPFFYVGFLHDYKVLIFLPVCCMCLYDMDAGKVCRWFVVTLGILIGALLLCCLSGTVRNIISHNRGRIVGAFGTINTTDFASYFVFLLVIAWCGMKSHKWYSITFFVALIIGITYIVWYYTASRTACYSGALLIIFALWDCLEENTLRKNKRLRTIGKTVNWLSVAAFPLIGIFTFWLVARFGAGDIWALQMENALSYRLSNVWNPLQKYGIQAFGNILLSSHGNGGTFLYNSWSQGYGYIDVAYGMLAIKYGWVITVIMTGFWIWLTARSILSGNNRIALAMVIFAFHGFSESRILDINYNIFLAMPFCAFSTEKRKRTTLVEQTEEKTIWFPLNTGVILSAGIWFFLPRCLSWLRTFFALKDWNSGTAAFNSFAVCCGILFLLWFLWKGTSLLQYKQIRNRIFIYIAATLVFASAGVLVVNSTIETGRKEQEERLAFEVPVVKTVQEAASLPVYAAEPEELYRRSGLSFPGLLFSSAELWRDPAGSMFVDQDVDLLEVSYSGGQYTRISPWSGLYSYDPAVIESLKAQGYTWTSYYSGVHIVDLADAALFNGRKLCSSGLQIYEGEKVEMKNMESDLLGGTFEIQYTLIDMRKNGDTQKEEQKGKKPEEEENPWDDFIACFEMIGEAGDRVLLQDWLTTSDFDEKGNCERCFTCWIDSCPKAFFAVETSEGVSLKIKEIIWRKIPNQ